MDNPLGQLLELCRQLHSYSDEELQRQLHQLAFEQPERLVHPVRLLLHSSRYFQRTTAPDAVPISTGQPHSLLSAREREVLALLAKGYTLPRIGKQLFISSATVNNHCARMREKLGLRGRNALITYASRRTV